jgi:N6-adenosine-specific RNA methylase IME4
LKFPKEKYNIIYADPPWHLTYVKQWNRNPKIKEKYKIVKLPYPTLTDEEIINLPVKNITSDDAILFIWCIDSRIPIL